MGFLSLLLLLFGLGERKQRRQRLASAPVCDKGISETPASSRAGMKRGTSSSSRSPQQQLVPLRGVDTHFPGSSGSQESQPDNRFSFASSADNASHLPLIPAPRPSHSLLRSLLYLYTYINVDNGMNHLGIRISQSAGASALHRAGFVREGGTEKLNLMVGN